MDSLDKQSTYVLLIGAANYPNWPQMNIPNVHVNLQELASLLSDPDYCGIPSEKITIIQDEDVENTSSAIYDFFDGIQTRNATVILYYSGHGLQSIKAMDDLFLATKNIRENKFESSAIRISELRKLFSDCAAARKILLLDCCYAGKITKGFLSDDASDTVAKLNEFEGTYIMAASSEYERARFDADDPNSPTKFTGKFVDIIKNGIDTDDEYCTLGSIYNQIRISFLTQKDAPKPVQVEQNNIANFPIFKNKKFAERIPADERAWKEAIVKNTSIDYYKFKQQFPGSTYVKEADKRIDAIDDENAWQKAKIRDTIGGYNFYLENYDKGMHVQEARQCLDTLTKSAQNDDEEKTLWMQAQNGDTLNLYKLYVQKYPAGRFVHDAQQKINAFEQKEKEENFWNDVSQKNTIAAYQQYLKLYANGKYLTDANNKISFLQKQIIKPHTIQPVNVNPPKNNSKTLKLIIGIGAAIILLFFIIGELSGPHKQDNPPITTDSTSVSSTDSTSINPANTDTSSMMADTSKSVFVQQPQQSNNVTTSASTKDYTYYWNLGNSFFDKENYQVALTNYTNAINLNSNEGGLYFNRGMCYANLKSYYLAISDYNKALKSKPSNVSDGSIYDERGNAYHNLNNMDAACADYKKSKDLNNENGKKDYEQYCLKSSSTSAASIPNALTVDVKFDVKNNGQLGMNIIPHFTINNAKGKTGRVNVWFYYNDHTTALKDYNNNYSTKGGNVGAWQDINPSYDPAYYNDGNNDFIIFMPYKELDLKQTTGQTYNLSLQVGVFIGDDEIKTSDYFDFHVTF